MCRRLIDEAAEQGIPIVITQTLRTNEEQEALYAQGRTEPGQIVTNARGGESYHNYGLAFDIAIVLDSTGKITWDSRVDRDKNGHWDFADVGVIGESLGLSWGGRWRKPDNPHFEFTFGLSVWELKAGTKIPD